MRYMVLMLLLFLSTVAQAQESYTTTAIGVSINMPNKMYGIKVYQLSHNNLGIFIDFKAGFNPRLFNYNYYNTMSLYEAAHRSIFAEYKDVWTVFNVGIISGNTKNNIMPYFGVGYGIEEHFMRFNNESKFDGYFWIRDKNKTKKSINFTTGIIKSLTDSYNLYLGIDTFPKSFSIGLSLKL